MGYGAVALVSVNLATTIMTIPIFIWLMRKFPRKAPWDKELFKRYLSIGFPILIINVTNSLIANYGNLMLKDNTDILELGYFAAGASLTAMISMLGSTAGTIFFPLFSKAYANNDLDYIRTQIKKYERFLYIMALPLFLCIGVFSDPIIPFLMSDKYIPSTPVFTILVFAAFFSINAMPYYNLLFGAGKFKESAWFNILFMVLFFGFLFLFIDNRVLGMGAIGLALVQLIHNAVKYMIWYYYAKSKYQVNVENTVIVVFIINVIYFGAFYFLKNAYLKDLNIFIDGLIAIVLLAIFYAFIYLLKILTKKDIDFLLAVLNLKKLVDYTKEELKK
jgi:O-antigen/teichoic acid export membrane protein